MTGETDLSHMRNSRDEQRRKRQREQRDQLRRTVRVMAEGEGGILLYLDQEGRGNGIANKTLQFLGLTNEPVNLIFTPQAVLMGMTYYIRVGFYQN